jgi:hypothetical protein
MVNQVESVVEIGSGNVVEADGYGTFVLALGALKAPIIPKLWFNPHNHALPPVRPARSDGRDGVPGCCNQNDIQT